MSNKTLKELKAKADADKEFYKSIKKRNAENMRKSQEDAKKKYRTKASKARDKADGENSRKSGEGQRPILDKDNQKKLNKLMGEHRKGIKKSKSRAKAMKEGKYGKMHYK